MEKLKISNKYYDVIDIKERTPLIIITFNESIDISLIGISGLELYTSGGVKCRDLSDYTTIYQEDGNTVTLSNDGSVYVEPVTETPTEPYTPTVEELLISAKQYKLSEISDKCQKAVYSGTDIEVSSGTKHFSLNLEDQTNIAYAENAVRLGATEFPYHADGELCIMYSAADILAIASGAAKHKLYHTTYCNHLNVWINRCTTGEEVNAVYYGISLPEDLNANFIAIVGDQA